MKKILVVMLVIISICMGIAIGYISSKGIGEFFEDLKRIRLEIENRMFDDHEVGNTDLIKEDEYLFDGLALNNPDDIDNAVDIILEAIENRSTDVVDKKWIPNEGKSHWYNIGTLEANADIVYATYALYLEQGGEEIPQVSDKLSAIDKKLHMNMNCFETAFVYAEDGSEAVAVLLTYTGAGEMSHTVPTLISVSYNQGEKWDYWVTTYDISDFCVLKNGSFAFLSYYLSNYAIGYNPTLVYYDSLSRNYYSCGVSITPGYQHDLTAKMEILSVTESTDEELSDHYVIVGYRGYNCCSSVRLTAD